MDKILEKEKFDSIKELKAEINELKNNYSIK